GEAVVAAAVERRALETADERAAREEARVEARALLVGERGDLDRDAKALAAAVELRDARDRHQDAEHPVVLAAVAHGIEMRAEEQRLRARDTFVAADDASHGIDTHLHAGLF